MLRLLIRHRCLLTTQSLHKRVISSQPVPIVGTWLVPPHSVALATPQLLSPQLTGFPFPGPYSLSILEERVADFKASIQHTLSTLQLKESSNCRGREPYHRWSDSWESKSLQSPGHDSMSHWPATSGPESKHIHNGNHPHQPSRQTPILPPIIDSRSYGSPTLGEPGRISAETALHTASLSRASSSTVTASEPEQVHSRPIRMQSILNPSGTSENQSRQRQDSTIESPRTVMTSPWHPPESPASSGYGSASSRTLPAMSTSAPTSIQGHPQTPSPHPIAPRVVSLGSMGLPSASIDAKSSPFLYGNGPAYSVDTGPSISLGSTVGSTPPIAPRPAYGFPPPPQTLTPPGRRAIESNPAPLPQSQSNSPTTSYSSYSHRSHASPGIPYSTPASQPPTGNYYHQMGSGPGSFPGGPQITLGSESSYGPVTSALGQSTYQLMTLDTDQGPIQVPVDVQAASKMADEKRKRNAGASARFRQRRKEKEREASQTIAKLESHIRDLGEEREYYRLERDYFRGLVYSSNAPLNVTPRIPSPRLRRSGPQSSGNGAAPPAVQWQQSEERGGQEGRNTRRRISAYSTTYELPQHSPPAMPQPNQQSVYGNAPPPPPPPPSYVHPEHQTQQPAARPPPPLPPAPTQLGPYDPSAPPGYERNWKQER